jgi:AcrR family transcriptional regulator
MPRTRPHLERDEKVDQLVDAAVRRLTDGGYQALSVADIARELGLAQNAIYWYFPSKDHLFVAALERIVDQTLSKKPRAESVGKRILWFSDRLDELQSLRAAMTERARVSTVVAEFEREVYAGIRMLLSGALSGSVAATDLDVTVDTVMSLVEGTLSQSVTRKRRAEIIAFGLERLAGITT